MISINKILEQVKRKIKLSQIEAMNKKLMLRQNLNKDELNMLYKILTQQIKFLKGDYYIRLEALDIKKIIYELKNLYGENFTNILKFIKPNKTTKLVNISDLMPESLLINLVIKNATKVDIINDLEKLKFQNLEIISTQFSTGGSAGNDYFITLR